jgi:hypothetical protein
VSPIHYLVVIDFFHSSLPYGNQVYLFYRLLSLWRAPILHPAPSFSLSLLMWQALTLHPISSFSLSLLISLTPPLPTLVSGACVPEDAASLFQHLSLNNSGASSTPTKHPPPANTTQHPTLVQKHPDKRVGFRCTRKKGGGRGGARGGEKRGGVGARKH